MYVYKTTYFFSEMKILLFVGLFGLLASTLGAEPDQKGINPDDYNMIGKLLY